jgi:ABC-type cobalt transport system substrate-binding protein
MKLRILIGAVIIIQAALLIFYTYNSYSEYGGTISVADETDIDELSSMLDSENIHIQRKKTT